MSKHLKRDLERIERGILAVGTMVEQSIHNAITALIGRRPELAKQVLLADQEIDAAEVELEEDCLKVLALHQPVAVIKVNSTLERMGDLACNIARGALSLVDSNWPLDMAGFHRQTELVREMVRGSLNALVQLDVQLARRVLASDDDVDTEKNKIFAEIMEQIRAGEVDAEQAVRALLVSRHLERIADLATNIAEDVVFMVGGEIIRHQPVN
jgi:phosphate transport system protein